MRIIIAETSANARGDVFTERMKDVVHALGYDVVHTNIAKPGREIDITARHRIEQRAVIAECKAQVQPIGGSDLNKFSGVLERERISNPGIAGYFVSMSGFTSTALLQEDEHPRFSLLGPTEIVDQLIAGRIIVALDKVAFAIGQLPQVTTEHRISEDSCVIAYRSGWAWLIRLEWKGEAAAIAFVHASGDLLPRSLAEKLAALIPGEIGELELYAPIDPSITAEADAMSAYSEYILAEYGHLTLEGIPVDTYVSAESYPLENLYIRPTLEKRSTDRREQPQEHTSEGHGDPEMHVERLDIGVALREQQRISILASPGAGKSTLIRRLAVAYCDEQRRSAVADGLPVEPWIPLVIRGRDVKMTKYASILDLLFSLPRIGEFPQYDAAFRSLVSQKLQKGEALLLIDGIDEIVAETDRRRLTLQLRTFIAIYPQVRLVITSREAGFRIVANEVSSYCALYHLAPLSEFDIYQLIHAWHGQVAPGDKTKSQIDRIAENIINVDRIRRLAVNPLLLTTLLYVQRWAGDIPKRRIVLYDKAIELLLMTWNVEGHAPLNLDEVVPQLAYLAFKMTERGKQGVTQDEAELILREARQVMPEILAYTNATPAEVISRIELRSSLLIQSGHSLVSGRLRPSYEFRHLTFQEYLTALAIAESWHSSVSDADPIEVLRRKFDNASWSEILVLCSTLLGRRAGSLIEAVCTHVMEMLGSDEEFGEVYVKIDHLVYALHSALEDEVQVHPDQARQAIALVISLTSHALGNYQGIISGRYAPTLKQVLWGALNDANSANDASSAHRSLEYFSVASEFVLHAIESEGREYANRVIREFLTSSQLPDQLAAASFLLFVAHGIAGGPNSDECIERELGSEFISTHMGDIVDLLERGEFSEYTKAGLFWALSWMSDVVDISPYGERVAPFLLDALTADSIHIMRFGRYTGWLLMQGGDSMVRIVASRLSQENIDRINEILSLDEDLDDFFVLGIAAMAATITDRLDERSLHSFMFRYRNLSDPRWVLILEKVAGVIVGSGEDGSE